MPLWWCNVEQRPEVPVNHFVGRALGDVEGAHVSTDSMGTFQGPSMLLAATVPAPVTTTTPLSHDSWSRTHDPLTWSRPPDLVTTQGPWSWGFLAHFVLHGLLGATIRLLQCHTQSLWNKHYSGLPQHHHEFEIYANSQQLTWHPVLWTWIVSELVFVMFKSFFFNCRAWNIFSDRLVTFREYIPTYKTYLQVGSILWLRRFIWWILIR
jgi:hypothetical protein